MKKIMNRVQKAFDTLPNVNERRTLFRMLYQPDLQEMEPAERRAFIEEYKSLYVTDHRGNRTGQFFNEIAGADIQREPDYADLGRRIMEKRNINYKGEPKDE